MSSRTLVFSTAPDRGPAGPISMSAWWDWRLFLLSQGNCPHFLQKMYSFSHLIFFCHGNLQNPSSSISGGLGLIRMETERQHADPALFTCSGSQERDDSSEEEGGEQETEEGKRRGPGRGEHESARSGIPNRSQFKSWPHTLPAVWTLVTSL